MTDLTCSWIKKPKTDVNKLETVQWKTTKMLRGWNTHLVLWLATPGSSQEQDKRQQLQVEIREFHTSNMELHAVKTLKQWNIFFQKGCAISTAAYSTSSCLTSQLTLPGAELRLDILLMSTQTWIILWHYPRNYQALDWINPLFELSKAWVKSLGTSNLSKNSCTVPAILAQTRFSQTSCILWIPDLSPLWIVW